MFLLYDPNNGNILRTYSWEPDVPSSVGAIVELPESNFDITVSKYDVVTNSIQLRPDAQEIQHVQRLNKIRRYRNALLDRCDWTQSADNDLTEQQRQQWADYRQLLRDITLNLPSTLPEKPRLLDWPQPPA